jgi:hypothetical protein
VSGYYLTKRSIDFKFIFRKQLRNDPQGQDLILANGTRSTTWRENNKFNNSIQSIFTVLDNS